MPRLPTVSVSLMASIFLAGCSMPAGMNDDCEWPPETSAALNVQNAAHRRHLINDVRVAEELGIRYDDSRLARGRLTPASPSTRDDCDTKLFNAIADKHSVEMADVRQARRRLADKRWDPVIHVPLAALYAAVTFGVARWIRRRFPREEKAAAIVATVFLSAAISGSILALGHLWGGVVEMVRVGNMHMTYRAGRLGWRGHAGQFFALGAVLFWLVVVMGYVVRRRGEIVGRTSLRKLN